MELTEADHQLIEAAKVQLDKAYEPVWHTVAGAIRAADGSVYSGVNVDSSVGSGGGICGEMAALSAVVAAGEKAGIRTIVAVSKDGVLPPCGVCRQTLRTHAPQVEVIVPNENGELIKVSQVQLLPYAYDNSHEG